MPGDDARTDDETESPAEDVPESPAEDVPESQAEDVPESQAEDVPESPAEDVPESPAEDVPESPAEDVPESPAADGFDLSRRKAVVGGLGVLVGAVAGAGATFATGGNGEIAKQEPNSDGKGTLGELRWILEEKHQLAVTSMVESDGTVQLLYETNATDRAESRREIGGVISAYGLIVANDGPSERLAAEIEGRFDEQATSYHVQAEWVKQWRSGEMSDASVVQRVFNTRTFPEGSEPE